MTDYDGWISPVGSVTLEDVIQSLNENRKSGAITTFSGIVRELSDNSSLSVTQLEVEAWEEQSSDSLKKISERIGSKYGLLALRIVHLEGKIGIGDPIVFIVISSIHRREAFLALEDAINAYKNESPVWKKEIYEDGSGNWITTSKN